MDVKSAFINGFIVEKAYVEQPLNFKNEKHVNYVYKHSKALYTLKQAHISCHEKLSKFSIKI